MKTINYYRNYGDLKLKHRDLLNGIYEYKLENIVSNLQKG